MIRNRQRRKRVIVALEGFKLSTDEQGTAPLRWAMREVIGRRDDVLVLAIINPINCMESTNVGSFCCLGGDQYKSPPYIGEKYIQFIHAQINQRRKQYLEILRPYYDRSKSSGVKFQVKVAVGAQPVAIVFEEAIGFKAAWIIMDRCFGGKKNLSDDFHIALVNDNEEAEEHNHLRPRDDLHKTKTDGEKYKKRTPCSLRGEAQIHEEPFITNPRSVKESVAQEKPHLRDSLPTITDQSRPFPPSFLVNISEAEKETILPSLGKESENEANIEQLKEETGNEAGNGLTLSERPTGETDNSVIEGTTTSVSTYYSEQHGQKEILEGGKGSSGYKRDRTRTTTALFDKIAFGKLSGATIVLRKPIELSWEEITDVTNGFHPDCCISKHDEYELYDGFLKDPHFPVLVKKLKGDSTGVVETEKQVTCSLFHQNIMGLSAYHESANATALVHAVADKGTLDQYLYGVREEQVGLKFKTRMKIAIEIGRCLRYLHEECPQGPVVHNNLQPHNIFLAHGYQPLVSGFGQATWVQLEQNVTDNNNRYLYKDVLEKKSMELVKADVFSFGVLLLRLFCQRVLPKDDKHLIELARPFLQVGAFHELLDQDMEDLDMYEIYRVMFAAIKCTKAKHASRPTMSQVVSILMGETSSIIESSPSSDGSVQGGAE